MWDYDDKSSCKINTITKDTHTELPTDSECCFRLKAYRRAMLAQSQNPSGKPGGNSKAANALVRNVCQGIRCCCCRNIF